VPPVEILRVDGRVEPSNLRFTVRDFFRPLLSNVMFLYTIYWGRFFAHGKSSGAPCPERRPIWKKCWKNEIHKIYSNDPGWLV